MIDYRKTEAGIIELRVDGRITKADIDAVFDRLKADMPAAGKLRVLEIVTALDGVSPSALWEDMRRGLPMLDNVEKAAVVTDHGWIEALSHIAAAFTSAEVRTFGPDEIDAARTWLKAA